MAGLYYFAVCGPALVTLALTALWSPQVMKRVRAEHIQMAVSCYLKRRQYVDSDGPLKQGLRLSQTAEEMATNLTGNQRGDCSQDEWQHSCRGPGERACLWRWRVQSRLPTRVPRYWLASEPGTGATCGAPSSQR